MKKTISICGSMHFIDEMENLENILKKKGFFVLVPKSIEMRRKTGFTRPKTHSARVKAKIEYDFIREHYLKIEKSDAILVLNYTKGNRKNYIGGNTFLEIGFAFILKKKIYLINPIPACFYSTEIKAMQPVVLNGDLSKII